MAVSRREIHSFIYLLGIILLAVALPLGEVPMSMIQLGLSANYLAEGRFREKLRLLGTRKSILIAMSVFLIHVIWLANTSDMDFALRDMRIKFPLLILPLIIGTTPALSEKNIKLVLGFFVASVVFASLVSTVVFMGWTGKEITDIRQISLFISHIRFGLLIILAIFFLCWFTFAKKNDIRFQKPVSILLILWLLVFLFILRSFTAFGILAISGTILSVYGITRINRKSVKAILLIAVFIIISGVIIYVIQGVSRFYNREEIDFTKLEQQSFSGNPYYHDTLSAWMENGNYVFIYICQDELIKEWEKRSSIKYSGLDRSGQELRFTLYRYMASKNLRKDSAGISKLSDRDITLIESGKTNYLAGNRFSLYPIMYELLWQLEIYRTTGNATGQSLSQRLEFLKAACNIIKENVWFGVGTGDLQLAFNEQYDKMNSTLEKDYRLRAHNQYLSFFIAFGVFGFLYAFFAIFFPVWYERKQKDMLFLMFFVIALLSFLNEDTLETQAGVTFFAFFYALFVFGRKNRASGVEDSDPEK